uniref:Uncharacterized protein n=1 Tax=Oryza barthii TaxID=65489 RepID=A0A0D3H1Z1_9ORYZ
MTQALVATRPLCRILAAWSGGGPTRAWRGTQRGARCKVTGRSFSCLLVLHPACVRRRGRPTQAPPAERAADGSTAREEPGETRSEILLHVGFLRCFLKNGELNVVKSFSSEITGAGVCTSRRKYRHAGCHAALAPGWLFGCRCDRRLVLWNQKEIEGVAE